MEIFRVSSRFPREEAYALTDQLRRASRSIPANIREGFAKRRYNNIFIRHLHDAYGSCEEAQTWIDMAHDCGYLDDGGHQQIDKELAELSAMLYRLIKNWRILA